MQAIEKQNKPGFKETIFMVHEMLRNRKSPEEVAESLGIQTERLSVYSDFVKHHMKSVLEKNFEVLSEILEDKVWQKLVDDYYIYCPANQPELNANAESFPAFIQSEIERGNKSLTNFHHELAQLEWQEFAVYSSQKEIPKSKVVASPVLNPTLEIIQFEYPVSDFVDNWRAKNITQDNFKLPRKYSDGSYEIIFLFRHPQTELAMFYKADEILLSAFKIVHDEISLEKAAKVTDTDMKTLKEILVRAESVGMVVLPEMM